MRDARGVRNTRVYLVLPQHVSGNDYHRSSKQLPGTHPHLFQQVAVHHPRAVVSRAGVVRLSRARIGKSRLRANHYVLP